MNNKMRKILTLIGPLRNLMFFKLKGIEYCKAEIAARRSK